MCLDYRHWAAGPMHFVERSVLHRVKSYVALNPPSRFRTQLFAYLFVAKNRAASATSDVSPNRPRGMDSMAFERPSGIMAKFVH